MEIVLNSGEKLLVSFDGAEQEFEVKFALGRISLVLVSGYDAEIESDDGIPLYDNDVV